MFLIDKNTELTEEKIAKIIEQFELSDLPKLQKYHNYYVGNQEIMKKKPTDIGKPCNKVITNYCYNIVENYQGYITGLDVAYSSENNFEDIQDILNYNDVRTEDNEYLRNALIYGRAFEIAYLDEEGRQRFTILDSRECIPVYGNTLNQELLYVIRYYKEDMFENDKYVVEVYGQNSVKKYAAQNGFKTLTLLEENIHYFNQVPITVFRLNADEESIFDKVMTLQDAYNNLLSSEIDDFEAFCDAYLVLKGITADEDDMRSMKQNRILLLDAESDAEYLTKSVSDTQIENMLANINKTIHKISNSPDFTDENLMAQSGVAIRYKLVGFENVSSNIVANMTKALQRRIELICSILNLKGSEEVWRDVDIVFSRNLPANVVETAQIINNLRGIVSDATLISQLPFIDDVAKEMELVKAEKQANLSFYSFGNENKEEDENEEEE